MNGLSSLATAYFFHFASSGIHLPLAASALSLLGLSASLIGSMFAIRSAALVVSPTIAGMLADRQGSGARIATGALILGGAALLALGFVEQPATVVVCFALYGVFGTPASPLLDGLTLQALGPHRQRFGQIRLFGTVGFGLLALGTNVAIGMGVLTATPTAVFVSAGALSILAGLCLLPLSSPRAGPPARGAVHFVLRSSAFWWLAILTVLQWGSHAAYTGFVVPLGHARGVGSTWIGVALTLGILVEIVSMRACHGLVESFGAGRVLAFALLVTLLRWLGLATTNGVESFVALHALHGISFGLFFPVVVTMLAKRMPKEAGQSAQGALVSVGFGAGGALGAFVAGFVFDRFGEQPTWLAMAALTAIGCAVYVLGARRLAQAQ